MYEHQLGKQAFFLGLQKLQCLFNDYYSLLCNYDCMGNPAPSRELSESNDSIYSHVVTSGCSSTWSVACLYAPLPS